MNSKFSNFKMQAKMQAIIILIACDIFSCKAPTEKTHDVRDGTVVIQGNKDRCKYVGSPQLSGAPIAGRWDSLNWEENEKYAFSELIEIVPQNNTTTLEVTYVNYCTVKSLHVGVAVSATAPVTYQSTSFTLGKIIEATKTEPIDGSPITCTLRKEAGTYRFTFAEDCLVIEGAYFVKRKN